MRVHRRWQPTNAVMRPKTIKEELKLKKIAHWWEPEYQQVSSVICSGQPANHRLRILYLNEPIGLQYYRTIMSVSTRAYAFARTLLYKRRRCLDTFIVHRSAATENCAGIAN